jgi:hypothetical protein
MQRCLIGARTASHVLLFAVALGLAPRLAAANEPAQPTPEGTNPRQLESEIEQYPGKTELPLEEPETRIPEQIQPRSPKPSRLPGQRKSAPVQGTPAGHPGSNIDAREVQRVFGQDARLVQLAQLDHDELSQLQRRLQASGHYAGEVDGVVGPKTRAALRAAILEQFALSRRLLQQGRVTSELASQLGLTPAAVR